MGIKNGPLFRDRQGRQLTASDFEPKFHERLEYVKLRKPHLISLLEGISEEYGVFRSFR